LDHDQRVVDVGVIQYVSIIEVESVSASGKGKAPN
jgi:hypothetical protein